MRSEFSGRRIFLRSSELLTLLRPSHGPRGSPPDFLWNLVASVNFMRLSSRKGARAVLSSALWQESGSGKWLKK